MIANRAVAHPDSAARFVAVNARQMAVHQNQVKISRRKRSQRLMAVRGQFHILVPQMPQNE